MTQMHLEDMGREALFYHKLHISYQPVMILGRHMPELKETLEAICLIYYFIHLFTQRIYIQHLPFKRIWVELQWIREGQSSGRNRCTKSQRNYKDRFWEEVKSVWNH